MATATETIIEEIFIEDIIRDPKAQQWPSLDRAVVGRYAAAMEEAEGWGTFPPVDVVRDEEGRYYVWDGFKRLAAADEVGFDEVPARVRDGSLEDAIILSCSANARHGQQRTPEVIKKSIHTLLEFPEWRKRSAVAIGKHVGCDRRTAKRYFDEWHEARKAKPEKVVDSKGRERDRDSYHKAESNGNGTVHDVQCDDAEPDDDTWEEAGAEETPEERDAREFREFALGLQGVADQLSDRCKERFEATLAYWWEMRGTVEKVKLKHQYLGGRKVVNPFAKRVAWLSYAPDPADWKACVGCKDGHGESTGRVENQVCPGCDGNGFLIGG